MGAIHQLLAGLSGGSDPFFANVVLLLHLNGTDGSTTFTDVKGHVMTANGNAQIDTAQSVFGGASALFDGTGDFISTPDSADWDFGTGDFTIEARIRGNATQPVGAIASVYTSATSGWFFRTTGTNLEFGSSGDTPINTFAWGFTPANSTWYAVAITRASGTVRGFVDGVQVGTGITNNENITGSTATLKIGTLNGAISNVNGWIDELRITKGVARYTASYIPATSEFPDS